MAAARKKLGEILIASGVVTKSDIDEALRDQSAGEAARLGDQLIALGKLTSFQLAKALASQHNLPYMGLPAIPPRVMAAIPLDYQQAHRLVPFRVDGDTVCVAVADPSNSDAIEELRYSLNRKVMVSIAPGDEIDAVHEAYASAQPAKPGKKGYSPRPTPAPTEEELFGSMNLDDPELSSSQSGLQDIFSDLNEPAEPSVPDGESISFTDSGEDEVSFSESSPSALESLQVNPSAPVIENRPVPVTVLPASRSKVSAPSVSPPSPSLPEWIRNPAPSPAVSSSAVRRESPVQRRPPAPPPPPPEPAKPPAFEWSGKLDDVPPSRLIAATVKALVLGGVISEEAILEHLKK